MTIIETLDMFCGVNVYISTTAGSFYGRLWRENNSTTITRNGEQIAKYMLVQPNDCNIYFTSNDVNSIEIEAQKREMRNKKNIGTITK